MLSQSLRSRYCLLLLNLRTNRNHNGKPVEKPSISIPPTAQYFDDVKLSHSLTKSVEPANGGQS
jgi:hypothetical protein